MKGIAMASLAQIEYIEVEKICSRKTCGCHLFWGKKHIDLGLV